MASTTNTDKDRAAYPLNRDLMASARLHLQHQMCVSSAGYHLHPSIPLEENTLVAEVGFGTGIWSLEFAKQLPTGGKIEAYDLSLAQCPPKGWWPENVTFKELDIFEPIPQELLGRYDVVHIRNFICVVQSGNPIPLLSALLKLLKPGGYLHWQEYDLQTNDVFLADPTKSAAEIAPKMKALVESIRGPESMQAQTSWVSNLHTHFSDAGAELVAQHRYWTAKEALMMKQEVAFLSVREWCNSLRARDPGSSQADAFEKISNDAHEECIQLGRGSMVDSETVTWVARKKVRQPDSERADRRNACTHSRQTDLPC